MSKCPELFSLCKLICSTISIQSFITAFLMQWSTDLHIILISFQQLNNLEQLGLANDCVRDGHVLRKADNIVVEENLLKKATRDTVTEEFS
ncbi:hypothetical protein SADUNF_Sadunf18G0098300 [Salix dunnii]|uniref:Uncharacterized protein n=1 Tax=Salix dunnii TaxID=1413687 RepID=A0A835J4W7_9ROSI|nr:hypothetical protein SADUNF_Sadunf18G0098300 [Salix dunnii]